MLLWYHNPFELKALSKQRGQECSLPAPFCLKAGPVFSFVTGT